MKQITLLLLTMLFFIVAYSQPLPDSIKAKYLAAKTDEQKGRCLNTFLSTVAENYMAAIEYDIANPFFAKIYGILFNAKR